MEDLDCVNSAQNHCGEKVLSQLCEQLLEEVMFGPILCKTGR